MAARCYTYTGVRVHKQNGEDEGRSRGREQRGVITDDCPLLRHGQSTVRNPVHSTGSQGTMIRRRSAMRWTAACVRAREGESESENIRLAEIGWGHANHSFSPRLRGRSLRGSRRFSRREVNDCLVMPPEMADN